MSERVHSIFTAEHPLSQHMDTLNNLTRSYMGLDEQNRAAFHAIVEMVQPKAPEDVAVLADNFYEFTVAPGAKTVEEYGRHIAGCHYELDRGIIGYIDFKRYGEDCIRQEHGSFTEYGYIAYRGTTPAVLSMLQQEDAPVMQMGGMS